MTARPDLRWDELGAYRCNVHPRRLLYAPYREEDFVELPTHIVTLCEGPTGIAIQCDDGLYLLQSDTFPSDTENWRIVKLVRR